jgi:type VII secretion-associated serine protease mycosin
VRHAPMVMLTARGGPRRPTRGAHQAGGAHKTRGARWPGCAHRAAAIAMVALPVLATGSPVPAAPAGSSVPVAPAGSPVRVASAVLRSGGVAPGVRSAEQAQLRAVGVAAAWSVTRGSGVTVGVLDSGVDATVPDLTGSVTVGPDYTAGADPPGYKPPHLHGTYIASLIAGHGSGPGDADGVIGFAPAATVLAIRVILDDQEPGFAAYHNDTNDNDSVGNGIRYAVRHGAGVINMSLGGDTPTRDLQAAIADAIAHGVVVVAAAGNDATSGSGFTPYSYPASFPGVISVAAVGADGRRAFFSDRNASVVLSAPGVNVVGAGPGGSYLEGSGTSPASAIVAGVAALIRSRYPRLSPVQVELAMTSSGSYRPAGGYSPDVGFGEVNAPAALTAAARLAATAPQTGLAAGAHFGPAPGPIQVVRRDEARIDGYGAAGAVLALVGVALLTWLIVRFRRFRSSRRAVKATLLSKNHPRLRAGQPGCITAVYGALAGRACWPEP